MISCINVCVNENDDSEIVITGNADKTAKVYSNTGKLQLLGTHKVDATPRAVDYLNDQLLVGTSGGSIYEFKGAISNAAAPEEFLQIRSHGEGETWGLTMIKEEGIFMYLTSGDDN